jgi:hypothetical protein
MVELETFSHDQVRALAWCVGAPGLMQAVDGLAVPRAQVFSTALAAARPWLEALNHSPEPLERYLAVRNNRKTGLHFEALLHFWLEQHAGYEVVAHNLQVRDAQRTLGAFDFIVRDHNGQPEHWEVAVKFYLQRDDSSEWSSWVGPNQRDRLDLKLERMRNHQLPLSARSEGRAALAALGVHEPPKKQAIVKGMFFAPWNRPDQRPEDSAPEQATGTWVAAGDFAHYASGCSQSRWAVRRAPDWLGPARRDTTSSFTTDDGIQRCAAGAIKRPEMWSRLRVLEDGVWFEDDRIFVVPNDWSRTGQLNPTAEK